ncbi:MAG: ATP-dependent helicase HrpB [Alphaproteobacteria bacterium]|nr:ATP-dependent helicase HrpB [Alphaproteobacteria bacterium]
MVAAPPSPLPVDEALPALLEALAAYNACVLVAPPGAGKTTRIPLALLDAPWLAGRRIVMQEPRRLAARAAARRMAASLEEPVGETVGYRVRLDSRVGPATRIEVVTDGLFLRRLQADPSLEGVGCVIFDELHERGLETDLSFALVREMQQALRPDLRIIAMSATLDPGPVADRLGGAPVVRSDGRMFPVETRFLPTDPVGRIEETTATATRRALADERGSILVFLPGVAEIRRTAALLDGGTLPRDVDVAPLYGDMSGDAQDRAIAPAAPGCRKVVLATSIAETSLTIEGVRVVIDSGLMRLPSFSPRTGMTRLTTQRVSQAAAGQRRGRAGRLEPGICFRLWTEAADRALPLATAPEILDADLAPLALELAAWGATDATALPWLTQPPAAALATARALLMDLGALDTDGSISRHGKAMVEAGVHPRFAHMLLAARARGDGRLAAYLTAILGERDFLRVAPGRPRDADLRHRVEMVDGGRGESIPRTIREQARRLMPRGDDRRATIDTARTGATLALAYPDRIGRRRAGTWGRYLLSGGRGAVLSEGDPLGAAEFIVVADLDGAGTDSRIHLAAALSRADIEDGLADRIVEEDIVEWSTRDEAVLARRRRRLGAMILDDRALESPDRDAVAEAMLEGVRQLGLPALPWTDAITGWRQRVAFARASDATWPDLSDAALTASLKTWLAPWLGGASRRAHLARIDLGGALRALVPWELAKRLDSFAPTHIEVPSGSRVAIAYENPVDPVLAVRLQELFGLTDTPRIAGGAVPLTLHLLSPARRPVQVTRDLASFWANGYRAVKAELKGRYPRHYWPDDPLVAQPTARVRQR